MKKRKLQQLFPRPSEVVLGVTWYSASEWARVKATAIDADLFEDSFSAWEAMATKSFVRIRKLYPNAVKVFIVADEFFAWCLQRARTNTSGARSEFVAEKLRTTPPPVTVNPSKKN
jgi:hypothetical protein